MALVFGDSFDHYATADITKKWTSTTAGGAEVFISTDAALPPHGTGLRITNAKVLEKTLPAALGTFVCGFWFRPEDTAAAKIVCAFMDSATPANIHVSLRRDATNHLTFCRDATVLATSTNTLTQNVWYHIEIKATISDAAGTYEVRVDGAAANWIAAATGADTRNSGNASIGSVRLYGGANVSTAAQAFSDFYVLDTTGAQASDFLGPCRFEVVRPMGAGTTAEWAGNYADNWVNAAGADGDSTFNQSSTAGQTDQFAMSNVAAGTIHAVQYVLMARKDAGAARTIRPVVRIGGSDYNGATVSLSASHAFLTEAASISPATSAAWDDAEVNDLEYGYEIVS
jgi:hypothetical protein